MKKILILSFLLLMGSNLFAQQPQANTTTGNTANAGVQLKAYEGVYQVQPNFIIQFFVNNGVLYSQATNQSAFAMQAKGSHTFVPTAFEATVTFVPGPNGDFTTISLTQNGNTLSARKLIVTPN
ncbi:MAG: hypothetical protein CL867_08710 [Cytophagaceae bacterium]|nr:hypothetical protein [Cytophagaceae bacterium]